MNEITSSPFFGIILSAICFESGVYLNKKTHSPLTNPLLVGIILCILVLKISGISLADYKKGGDIISILLSPVTAVLAVSVYNRLDILKNNLVPILGGAFAGSLASVVSAYFLCRLFGLDDTLTVSLLPKSVTTPIAIEISKQLGGNTGITVAAVIYTGILGAILSPILIKFFKINNAVTRGVAIGTSSHAMGTTAAFSIGETEGAMSSVSIGVAGIMTVIIAMFL